MCDAAQMDVFFESIFQLLGLAKACENVLTVVIIGKLIGSDKIAFAWNQQASATAHMAPEMNAGKIAWL